MPPSEQGTLLSTTTTKQTPTRIRECDPQPRNQTHAASPRFDPGIDRCWDRIDTFGCASCLLHQVTSPTHANGPTSEQNGRGKLKINKKHDFRMCHQPTLPLLIVELRSQSNRGKRFNTHPSITSLASQKPQPDSTASQTTAASSGGDGSAAAAAIAGRRGADRRVRCPLS